MLILTNNITEGINRIIEEYNSIEETENNKKSLYKEVQILTEILDNYTFIKDRFYPNELIIHKNLRSRLDSFEIQLDKITSNMKDLINMHKFLKFVEPILFILIWIGIMNNINLKHDSFTEKLYELSKDFVKLKQQLFGKALLFDENKLGCKLWLLCNGENTDNISKSKFIEEFIVLFRKTYKEIYTTYTDICNQYINLFAHNLDGCIGGQPDTLISINELNFKTEDLPVDYPLIKLLGLDLELAELKLKSIKPTFKCKEAVSISKEDSSIVSQIIDPINQFIVNPIKSVVLNDNENSELEIISYEHTDRVSIDYTQKHAKVEVFKNWTGYGAGSGWPTKEAFTIITPSFELSRILIKYTARDQEFGGTGHSSIRYKLNDEKPTLMYFIDRNVTINNKYVYQINENIPANSKLTLYICCPEWSGWATHLDYAKIIFVK